MIELMVILIPLTIGAALVQLPQVIILIFLLHTRRGVANGLAYVGSKTAFHLILGGLLWLFMSGVETSVEAAGGQFSLVVGAGLSVAGLVLLVYALRTVFSAPDDDAAAAGWLDKLESVSPWQAALVGIALLALDPKDWLFTLSGVELIAAADLSSSASLLVYLLFILLVQSFLLGLLLLRLIAPDRAQQWLGAINAWLKQYMRLFKIGGSVLLGGYLLAEGLQQLGLF